MIIHQDAEESIFLHYDSKSSKLKISGIDEDNIDPAAKRFVDASSFFIEQEVIKILKDSSRIEKILDHMSREELTNMLLQYKLLVEKRLFDRT